MLNLFRNHDLKNLLNFLEKESKRFSKPRPFPDPDKFLRANYGNLEKSIYKDKNIINFTDNTEYRFSNNNHIEYYINLGEKKLRVFFVVAHGAQGQVVYTAYNENILLNVRNYAMRIEAHLRAYRNNNIVVALIQCHAAKDANLFKPSIAYELSKILKLPVIAGDDFVTFGDPNDLNNHRTKTIQYSSVINDGYNIQRDENGKIEALIPNISFQTRKILIINSIFTKNWYFFEYKNGNIFKKLIT